MNNETFLRQIAHQKKHWWFQARKKIIFKIIKEIKLKKNLKILDFGAGSGVNTDILSKFGKVDIFEKNKIALNYLKNNIKINKSFSKLKMKKNHYDFILVADVIEHIKRPKSTLLFLKKILKKNGYILITVPAYQFLFSKKDEKLGHFRRYDKKSLLNEIINFKVVKVSYFNTLLYPLIATITLWNKFFKIDYIKDVEKTPNLFLNNLFYIIFSIESFLLKFFNLPFGVSIYIIIKK